MPDTPQVWCRYRALSKSHRFTVEIGPARYVFRPARSAMERVAMIGTALAYHVGGTDIRHHEGRRSFTVVTWPHHARGTYVGSLLIGTRLDEGHELTGPFLPVGDMSVERI